MNTTSKQIDFYKAKSVANSLNDSFGLYIKIALDTGLRVGDILKLNKGDFFEDKGVYYVNFIAEKTKKKAKRPISANTYKTAMACTHNDIFRNHKYKCLYSKMWVNRNIKKHFPKEYNEARNQGYNLTSHSFRKTSGAYVYERNGLETARDFLQHDSYDTTKAYLAITETELNEKIIKTFAF